MKRITVTLFLLMGFFFFQTPETHAQDYSGVNPRVEFFRHNGYSPIYGKVTVYEGDTLARIRFRGHVNSGIWHTGSEITSWITGPVTDVDFESNLIFKTDSMNRMSILHNGNVGINTVAPQQLFTVSHETIPVLRFDRASAGARDFELYNGVDGNLFFRGGGDAVGGGLTNFMVINYQGRVGIGTDTPDQILTVSDADPVIRLERDGAGENDYELINAASGNLYFRGGADGTGAGLTNHVVFDNVGRVGIGTDNPDQILTVSDADPVIRLERDGAGENDYELINAASGNLYFRGGSDGTGAGLTNHVVFDNAGQVGIGTDTPDQLLTLSEIDNPVLRMDRSAGGEFDMELSLQTDGDLFFRGGADDTGAGLNDLMMLTNDGKLAIGTTNTPTSLGGSDLTNYTLFAAGGILTEELRVRTGWADYVFENTYERPSLKEVEKYIDAHGTLPNMPTTAEVESNGLELGNITVKQQEKIEELFLYMIELEREMDELRAENATLRQRVEELEK